jgi:hypothetical protein
MISIAVCGLNVFSGSQDGGVWRRPILELTTDVRNVELALPLGFELSQNFPNPFNPATTIRYALPVPARVRLTICNLLGVVIHEIVNEEQRAGMKEVVWRGIESSGLYFCRIEATPVDNPASRFEETKKMLLLR